MRLVRDPAEAARIRAEHTARIAEAVQQVDFPVYAAPGEPVLNAINYSEQGVRSVQLTVGEPLDGGPLAVVRTDRETSVSTQHELEAAQRQWSIDGETPQGTPTTTAATVSVSGRALPTELLRHDDYLAFQVAMEDTVLTAVFRGYGTPPQLDLVTDLFACHERRADWVNRLAERHHRLHPPEPVPELEPAPGAAAHHALIEYVMTNRPRDPRWAAMWERAIQHQQELTGQEEDTAVDAVMAMVNECTTLTEKLPAEIDAIRNRVIDQCVRYTVGEQVETEPIQRLWREFFAKPVATGKDHTERQHITIEPVRKEDNWLADWTTWITNSPPHFR